MPNDQTIIPAGELLALIAEQPGDMFSATALHIERVLAVRIPTDPDDLGVEYFTHDNGWTGRSGPWRVLDIATLADIERVTRHHARRLHLGTGLADCSGLAPWVDLSSWWAANEVMLDL